MSKTIRVSHNGSAEFSNIQDAIDSVPLNNTQRVIIHIAPGTYKQPIYVPKTKNFITILGCLNAENTILSWSNTATSIQHHQKSDVIGKGTFASGTFIIEGHDFVAKGITFENAAPQGSGQAVAIRVTADRCAFYECRFLGWQDTVYLHYGRHYLKNCYIEGSVDFIFGNATSFLEGCWIHCKSDGFITAHKRTTAIETTGFVFYRCRVTGTHKATPYVYLGRPWGPYSRVIFAYTEMDACIRPEGWANWDKTSDNYKTSSYYEYKCTGPGSDTSKRVNWVQKAEDNEIQMFVTSSFIDSEQISWLKSAEALVCSFACLH